MKLDFLNDLWDDQKVASRTHCNKLNSLLTTEIDCISVSEDILKTKYLGNKRWDLHFPKKKVAIEYKSISVSPISGCRAKIVGQSGKINKRNFLSNMRSRTEQAMGCACDLKAEDPEYKVGYLLIFVLDRNTTPIIPKLQIDNSLSKFDRMVKNNLYDFFCPMITFGVDQHYELLKNYKFNKFIKDIKNVESKYIQSLEEFFV